MFVVKPYHTIMTQSLKTACNAVSTLSIIVLLLSAMTVHGQNGLTYTKRDKNLGAAFLSSVVVPGAGQLYNDQMTLGLSLFGGTVALYGGGAALLVTGLGTSAEINYVGWYSVEENTTERDALIGSGIALLSLGSIAHIFSIVYAPIKSKQINEKNGDKSYTSSSARPAHYYSMGMTRSGGVGVTLNF
jgi:hypothetical protein